jgi:hypothetical protein
MFEKSKTFLKRLKRNSFLVMSIHASCLNIHDFYSLLDDLTGNNIIDVVIRISRNLLACAKQLVMKYFKTMLK